MKKLIKYMLRRVGLEIHRLPPQQEVPFLVSAEEVLRLEEVLEEFAASQPVGDDLADVHKIRSYLSNERISFFHEVLRETERLGVSLERRKVADFGCGTGYLLRLIDERACPSHIMGFDTFTRMNGLALMLCPRATVLDTAIQDVEDTFDVIFCTEVLEHLVDPATALRKITSCLSQSGSLILTVPNGRMDRHVAGDIRDDGSAYWGHVHFWSPESWPLFLESSLDYRLQILTTLLDSGENFAVVSRTASAAR
jgi:2-polyprenyl-3-methyl-5-hydroxy-6-metoxy-1,4-benzoquinol methylase